MGLRALQWDASSTASPHTQEERMPISETFHPQPDSPAALFQHKLQYSREEAAALIGVSLRTLDRLVAEKEIVVRRIGRRVLISRDVLTQFIKRDHPTGVIQ
jgi:excisionase family DNA binding protein